MVDFTCEEDFFGYYHRRNVIAFWTLGLINNFHYCLILSAADNIASSFDLKSYIALVSWANIAGGVLVRLLNAFVCDRAPYNVRVLVAAAQTLSGILLVSFSPFLGTNNVFRFAVALCGVVVCGNGSSYGESVMLGYMERFPSAAVGAWSSGTGMSGVLASLLYMGLSAAGLSNSTIFLLSIPFVVIYLLAFGLGLQVPVRHASAMLATGNWKDQASWRRIPTAADDDGNNDDPSSITAQAAVTSPKRAESCLTALRNWKEKHGSMIRELHHMTFPNNINLFIVYVAEYAIQFVAPFTWPCHMSKTDGGLTGFPLLIRKNAFVLTQLAYQVGVLCSRSSLACIRIRRVWILSLVQSMNAVLWFIQAKTLLLSSADAATEVHYLLVLLGYMYVVGLFGGASYVNVFFNILESMKEPSASGEDAQLVGEPYEDSDTNNVTGGPEVRNNNAEQRARRGELEHQPLSLGTVQSSREQRIRRQLAMNIGALYATAGITGGSVLDVVLSNTLLKGACDS